MSHTGSEMYADCPECGEEYTLRGLNGHLRMSHGLAGDTLSKVYAEAKENAERREKPPTPVQTTQNKAMEAASGDGAPQSAEIEELKGMIQDLRGRLEESESRDTSETTEADKVAFEIGSVEEETDQQPDENSDSGKSLPPLPKVEGTKVEGSDEISTSTFMDEVRGALDELVAARMRYGTALEATDPEPEERSGGVVSRSARWMLGKGEFAEDSGKRSPSARKLVEECREEVKRCEDRLERALHHADIEVDNS